MVFDCSIDTHSRAHEHFVRRGLRRHCRSGFFAPTQIARSVSLHRCGVVHQTCLRSVGTMMTSSNSLTQRGRRVAQSGERSIRTTIPFRHHRTDRTAALPPEVTAAAEFRVIDLVTQHDPQPDTQLACCRHTGFAHSFLGPAFGGRSAAVRDHDERRAGWLLPKGSGARNCPA